MSLDYKEVNIGNAGTTIKYGSNDLQKISKLLNGVITGVGGPKIKTQDGWGFWDGVLYFRNQADSRSITIRGPSNVPSTNLDLELPPIIAPDRLAAVGLANIWTSKQQMEGGIVYKEQVEPATPSAGYFHVYVEGGHLKKKNPSGGIIDYDNVSVGIPSEYDDQSINIKNPAGTFHYTIKTSAITANRKAIIPVLAADDTFAFLGVANVFSEPVTVKKNAANLMTMFLDSNVVSTDMYFKFDAKSSTNVQRSIAQINAYMITNTNTDEDGSLNFGVISDGTMKNIIGIDKSGFFFGETNFRGGLSDAGLSDFRMFTFPDISTQLAGLGSQNIFTDVVKFVKDTSSSVLTLVRPTKTVGNGCRYSLSLLDSADVEQEYGQVRAEIGVNTAGAEEGRLILSVVHAGVMDTAARVDDTTGAWKCGGFNERVELRETDLTSGRVFKFPNVDARLSGVALQSGATVDINTTNAEQDLLNYSVAANQLTANGRVKFMITGYLLQNQATGTTYTFKIKFGGTVMWEDVTVSVSQSATKFPFRIEGEIYNKNATNAQGMSGQIIINDGSAATTGIGDLATAGLLINNFDSEGADTTKDTTTSQTLQVTVTMSVSNAAVHTVVKNKEVVIIT